MSPIGLQLQKRRGEEITRVFETVNPTQFQGICQHTKQRAKPIVAANMDYTKALSLFTELFIVAVEPTASRCHLLSQSSI